METTLLMILCIVLFGMTVFFALKTIKFYEVNKKLSDLQKTVDEYVHALQEGQKAIDLALKYEDFYSSTVGDVGEVVDALNNLIGKRQMLSDDPDVQNLVRLLAIAHDTLLGYINAKSPTEQQPKNTDTDK